MFKKTALVAGVLLAMGGVQQSALAAVQVVDDFSDADGPVQDNDATVGTPVSSSIALTGVNVLGPREIVVDMTSGTGNSSAEVNGGNVYQFANTALNTGDGEINYTPAAAVDLIDSDQDTLRITVDALDHAQSVDVTVNGVTVPMTLNVGPNDIAFSAFAGVDFSAVTAASVTFSAAEFQDMVISDIRTADLIQPDLDITKDSSPTSCVAPGDTINYTVTIDNNSGEDTTGVSLADAVPAELTLNCTPGSIVSNDGGATITACNPNDFAMDLSDIAAGATGVSVTFNAVVNAGVADSTSFTNSATVTWTGGTGTDTDTATNSTCDPVVPPTDPVPTMGEWAMGIMMASLSLVGLFGVRRRMRS